MRFGVTLFGGATPSFRFRSVVDDVTRLYRQVAILKQRLWLKNGIT
jgi:hypothetical protein